MPTFEFEFPKGKRPDPDEVPTRVSVAGKEYDVEDGCIEAPISVSDQLAMHGFKLRKRPSVTIRPQQAAAEEQPQESASPSRNRIARKAAED